MELHNKTNLVDLNNLELLAKQVVEGFISGIHKSPFHGFSVEFAEHKLYNPGESTKHIDWKIFGRTDKLFTKKYDEETNLRSYFVLDSSSSMFLKNEENESKLNYAIVAIASLIQLLKKQRDAFGLAIVNENVEILTEAKSSIVHLNYLYEELSKKLNPNSQLNKLPTNWINSIHEIAETIPKRSLVILFSDLLDNEHNSNSFIDALSHLKHNKHEVIVFQIINKKIEIDFELGNRPLKLIDLESGEEIKVQSNEFKETYKKEIKKFYKDIESKCQEMNVDFYTIDINESIEKLLEYYLVKRKKVK
jgi:uncharacterized protein (DUF58 family)